jgi:tetratricopeptide (TPR) repeat protein
MLILFTPHGPTNDYSLGNFQRSAPDGGLLPLCETSFNAGVALIIVADEKDPTAQSRDIHSIHLEATQADYIKAATFLQDAVDCVKKRQHCFDFATANVTQACHQDWELLADCHALHGIAKIKSGDYSGSIGSLRASLDMKTVISGVDFRAPINWRHIGVAKGKLGDLDGEISAYQHAIDIDSNYVKGYLSLAIAIGSDSPAKVLALLKQAKQQPLDLVDKKRVLELEGLAFVKLNNLNEAVDRLQLSWDIELPPAYKQMDAHTTFALGSLLLNMRDVEGAIKADKAATSLDPSNFEAWLNLGTALHAKATQLDNQRKVIPHKVFKEAAAA